MRRPGIAALTLVVLCAAAPARADGLYFTESFGGTRFENQLARWTDGGVRIRVGLGYRWERVALETWFGVDAPTGATYATSPIAEPVSYGVDLKYAVPLRRGVEAYVRGSASRMELDGSLLDGYGGRGLGVGTGVQLEGKVPLLTLLYLPSALICLVPDICSRYRGPKMTAALYLDQGYDFYRLHAPDGRGTVDAEATRWTLGFALGADF